MALKLAHILPPLYTRLADGVGVATLPNNENQEFHIHNKEHFVMVKSEALLKTAVLSHMESQNYEFIIFRDGNYQVVEKGTGLVYETGITPFKFIENPKSFGIYNHETYGRFLIFYVPDYRIWVASKSSSVAGKFWFPSGIYIPGDIDFCMQAALPGTVLVGAANNHKILSRGEVMKYVRFYPSVS